MSDEKLSFLRDDAGRFAPKETPAPTLPTLEAEKPLPQSEPAPQAQTETPDPAAPPPTPQKDPPPPGHIPLEALLDTREKLKKFQAEAEEYKRKFEELTRKPAPPVDPLMDPEGFARQREKDRQDTLFETSWFAAQAQHGEATVKAAEEWLAGELENNPGLFQTIARQRHPYDFVVKQHKRALSLSKIGDDEPETWAEKWARENGYVKADQQPAQAAPSAAAPSPQQRTPLPRPSLANAPSAGGNAPRIPVGDGVAFGAVFKS